MADFSQQAVLDFLRDRGGRVGHADLIERFRAVFPEEPAERAAVRNTFKKYVDGVAFVKTEDGVKFVCLKKKFRGSVKEPHSASVSGGTDTGPGPGLRAGPGPGLRAGPGQGPRAGPGPGLRAGPGPARCGRINGDDAEEAPALPRAAREAQQQGAPGSGYGNDRQVKVPPHFSPETILPDGADEENKSHEFVCRVEEVNYNSGEMGNRVSFLGERGGSRRESRGESRGESSRERAESAPRIPEIAVIEASPLPAEGSVFTLPGPAPTGTTGQVDSSAALLSPAGRQAEAEAASPEGLNQEAEQVKVVTRGSPHRSELLRPGEGEDEGLDSHSLCGSEGLSSPKGSRKHFIELMMSSSPQVRRSLVFRGSVCLSSRSDSDSSSLISSTVDDDRASVALDPLEHEWMMCASDGEWGSLQRLVAAEPGLLLRKDFVTGFTCLHWAAKHGKPELIAMIINFAKQHNVPISVDVRSNTGYTPLHIAAMHNHMEVVKLLVGAYNADVEVRDYSGRKACQYLTDNVSVDIRDIIGAYEQSESENAHRRDGGRWRFSKVLQSNLKPLRLLSPHDGDCVDGEARPREKLVRRNSTFSRMRPKLEKLRLRTSQVVHSTSFHGPEEQEESRRGSFRSRPRTHLFW